MGNTTPRDTSGQFAKTAFTVLVTGSRNWDKPEAVRDEIVKIRDLAKSLGLTPSQVTLVHGNAQGADRTAGTFAAMVGFNVTSVPANWKRHQFVETVNSETGETEKRQVCRCDIPKVNYCKMAGITRNLEMLNDHQPDMVLAFNRDSSSGTMHTIQEARKRGLITSVVRYEDLDNTAVSEDTVTVSDGTSQPTGTDNLQPTDDPFAQYRV